MYGRAQRTQMNRKKKHINTLEKKSDSIVTRL
jgi:hypothetical protein